MEYGAITIDTSVIDQHGLILESGLLKTLEQFKGQPAPLVLSEIVVRETHSHIVKKTSEVRSQVKRALRISNSHLVFEDDKVDEAEKLLLPPESDEDISRTRIGNFIDNTGAEIISASGHIGLDDVIKKYFHSEPPFSVSGKKKNEFPDAIALMSLEAWAKEKGIKILAVSNDGDWKDFASGSEYIDVVDDLAGAIAVFQPDTESLNFCMSLATTLPSEKPKELYSYIERLVADSVSEIDAYPDASSDFYWESDVVEIIFEEFQFIVDENKKALLRPVQAQENSIVIEAKIWVNATASCIFYLAVHDSIDKDYVPIGDATAFASLEFESEILFTLEGDFVNRPDEIELTKFELLSYPSAVDFGDVEPDWWSENA